MEEQQYSVGELAELSQVSRRTIRYYVQVGLIPAPTGKGKGARYGLLHLERLLKVRRLQADGLSLERITDLLDESEPSPRVTTVGELRVVTRLSLADGITLEIDTGRAGLEPAQLRELARECVNQITRIQKGDKE